MTSPRERQEAIHRAENAIEDLKRHSETTSARLRAATTQLNIVFTWRDAFEVWDAVMGLESSVLDVYGGIPSHR